MALILKTAAAMVLQAVKSKLLAGHKYSRMAIATGAVELTDVVEDLSIGADAVETQAVMSELLLAGEKLAAKINALKFTQFALPITLPGVDPNSVATATDLSNAALKLTRVYDIKDDRFRIRIDVIGK